MKAIEATNLSYAYPDGTKALDNVNFTIEQGENIAILGPNGAGKSTLLHQFNGLLTPTSGSLYVLGKEVKKQNLTEIRQHVGLVFQDPDDQLFARTLSQDIAFGPTNLGLSKKEVEERVRWALDVTELKGLEVKAPQNLSTGQKKRAAIAGVLAMKPEIMILDEPMANLDPRTATRILRLLLQLNRELGITLIIATHDVDLVPLFATKICILNKGKIILEDTPEAVFSQAEKIRSLDLRLPRITHLFEILRKNNQVSAGDRIPLTIGDARREIMELLETKDSRA